MNEIKELRKKLEDLRTEHRDLDDIIARLAEDIKSGPSEGESADSFRSRINSEIELATRVALRSTETGAADSENWMNRGLIYQNLIGLEIEGSGPFAISMYEEAIKRNPHNPLAYSRIGNTYLAIADALSRTRGASARLEILDNLGKAEENLQNAIELYDNYGQALYNLAVVYDRRGELPQAIRQFEQLAISNPRDSSVVFQLGLLYYRNNQKAHAIAAWEQAVRLFPDYSNARWYLSLSYEERGNEGDSERALAQVREILVHNPDNELVTGRIEQLEAGVRIIPPEKVLDQTPLN